MYTGFIVRSSARFQGKFYIDEGGHYATGDIAETLRLKKDKIEDIYLRNDAVYEDSIGVYFFTSREKALDAKSELDSLVSNASGKMVFLTYEEIDFIRQALINEGSNVISVRNELKKCIFDKFNH